MIPNRPVDSKALRVVVMGGGSGSFNILSGLREHPRLWVQSIVTMMDSGGHSGELRDAFGVLPPGDIRRCLTALSDESPLLRELFSYRFEEVPLKGSNFGNLFILALTKVLGSERDAIEAMAKILKIRGEVIPVTLGHTHLHAELENGEIIYGEGNIDSRGLIPYPNPAHDPAFQIVSVYLEPRVSANPMAEQAIATCDAIVLAPGDMYTSVLPNLLVDGIPDAIKNSPAPLVYILNMMTKHGETDGWSASRHVAEIAEYGGRIPDAVITHEGAIPDELLNSYEAENASQIEVDSPNLKALGVKIVRQASVMSASSVVRHDPMRTADVLEELFVHLGLTSVRP